VARAVVVLLLAAAAAPSWFPFVDAPRFWDETLGEAADQRFAYQAHWLAAVRGDEVALERLLRFSADAAGGLGHGVALTELADCIGDVRMAGAIGELDGIARSSARRYLEAGVAYRREWQDPSLTPKLYPLSWAAASSSP
jgi:hypothetical protein